MRARAPVAKRLALLAAPLPIRPFELAGVRMLRGNFPGLRSLCPGGSCAAARIQHVFATLYSQAVNDRVIVLFSLPRSFDIP